MHLRTLKSVKRFALIFSISLDTRIYIFMLYYSLGKELNVNAYVVWVSYLVLLPVSRNWYLDLGVSQC